MNRPPHNWRTMAAVREHFAGPELNRYISEAPAEARYLMIASEGIGGHVETVPAGFYVTLDDAVTGHTWDRGVPEYLVDTCADPGEAIVALDLCIAPAEKHGLEDFGIEYETEEGET
jgi:hypothetical protein